MTCGIYEKIAGHNATVTNEERLTKFLAHDNTPRKNARRHASPWMVVLILGPALGGFFQIIFPEDIIICIFAGLSTAYLLGNLMINQKQSTGTFSHSQEPNPTHSKQGKTDRHPTGIPNLQHKSSSFISFRKNVTGQFYELIQHHFSRRTSTELENAISSIHTRLPEQLSVGVACRDEREAFTTKYDLTEITPVSLENFLDICETVAKEKGYWKRDITQVFDQLTIMASRMLRACNKTDDINQHKFDLFNLVVLNYALRAHNDSAFRTLMGLTK